MQKHRTVLKRLLIVLLFYVVAFGVIFLLSYINYSCPFRKYLGVNCIGCGMTRAFFAIINLEFPKAFYLNPLIYPLAIAIFIGSVYYIFFYNKSNTNKK